MSPAWVQLAEPAPRLLAAAWARASDAAMDTAAAPMDSASAAAAGDKAAAAGAAAEKAGYKAKDSAH